MDGLEGALAEADQPNVAGEHIATGVAMAQSHMVIDSCAEIGVVCRARPRGASPALQVRPASDCVMMNVRSLTVSPDE